MLQSSQSTSSTELTSLQRAFEDAEKEKRDLLIIIDRLKEDASQRDEELQTLRESLKVMRKDSQAVEAELREVRFTETSTKVCISDQYNHSFFLSFITIVQDRDTNAAAIACTR